MPIFLMILASTTCKFKFNTVLSYIWGHFGLSQQIFLRNSFIQLHILVDRIDPFLFGLKLLRLALNIIKYICFTFTFFFNKQYLFENLL
jgi:hypothetical protein